MMWLDFWTLESLFFRVILNIWTCVYSTSLIIETFFQTIVSLLQLVRSGYKMLLSVLAYLFRCPHVRLFPPFAKNLFHERKKRRQKKEITLNSINAARYVLQCLLNYAWFGLQFTFAILIEYLIKVAAFRPSAKCNGAVKMVKYLVSKWSSIVKREMYFWKLKQPKCVSHASVLCTWFRYMRARLLIKKSKTGQPCAR